MWFLVVSCHGTVPARTALQELASIDASVGKHHGTLPVVPAEMQNVPRSRYAELQPTRLLPILEASHQSRIHKCLTGKDWW